ncbi:ABC transporter ATP-binding protein [Acuticoccus sp. I52.16.1]|uniref:ABC transporter ATP-binding protein n=1 Tax=Acuticoccus sp. I52.16.1 TaxID=2928472 RepID=UPI001FD20C8C|nr:ABC transporter ATP-binding protein [Acuticoccus sp. I52.16.1]UOM35558.1 ABC transporter ATP-binding protein [Acuticoccus sp. I52.16.1]
MDEYAVEAVGLSKSYGNVRALKTVDVRIAKGEYFVLLGPSGGGKTTLLRLIGGFLKPTSGDLKINGRSVVHLPPNKRPTSMVFQSYALFPHMTVAQNIGYGLKIKGVAKDVIATKVDEMLEVVGLAGYGDRRTFELSGGQQQRVQLARALVLESDIILLDEPLAALDAKLRKDMCFWLKQLQERLGITFIHVTHNQEEAMSVGDRLAIVSGGELVEAGTVRELYEAPRRRFTADFIGENNILDGRVTAVADGVAQLDVGVATVAVPTREPVAAGAEASLSVRSETMRVAAAPGPGPSLPVTCVETFYLGFVTRHQVRLADGREINVRHVSDQDGATFAPGTAAFVTWDVADGRLHTS